MEYWRSVADQNRPQVLMPPMPSDATRWYQNSFDQQVDAPDYHSGLAYTTNGTLAACPPGYN
jgi:hypothetical protein